MRRKLRAAARGAAVAALASAGMVVGVVAGYLLIGALLLSFGEDDTPPKAPPIAE